MKYYVIAKEGLIISENQEILLTTYDKQPIFLPEDYEIGKYIVVEEELVPNPNWDKEQEEKEKERVAHLSLTKREVFLALYRDKQITPEQIKAQIQDPEALIEFEYATDYYRGNPLINEIGEMLGYTSEQLDYLFEHGELPKVEESEAS